MNIYIYDTIKIDLFGVGVFLTMKDGRMIIKTILLSSDLVLTFKYL